jgi:hypothetical protein
VLDAVPRRRGTPVIVTEAGYTTAPTPFRSVRVTPAEQARYLRQIMDLPVVRSGRIRAVVWFNLQDNPRWPGGLRTLDGRPKQSHAVFRRLARSGTLPADLRVRSPIRLTRAQLLVNQRISQAAIRRLASVQRRLDRGLTRDDLRPGGIRAASFGPDVTMAHDVPGAAPAPPPLARRPADPPPPARRSGAAASVRRSAAQLLVNQRVAQAAVRRADGLSRRLAGGLTGGDLRDGAIDAARLAPGSRVVATRAGFVAAPSRTRVRAPGHRAGDAVRLTAAQVAVNQRISQAAVRRANTLARTLAAGITSDHIRPGSLTAADLAPPLRAAAGAG